MGSYRAQDGRWHGPLPDIDVPSCSLYDLLLGNLTDDEAGRTAVLNPVTGSMLTYGELRFRVDTFATWLHHRGVGAGDVVGVLLPNGPTFVAAFHGILRSGAAAAPLPMSGVTDEIRRQLELSGARTLVVHPSVLSQAEEAADAVGLQPTDLIVIGDVDNHVRWIDVLETIADPPDLTIDPATHVACLLFSSGTAGMPKAVQLTHRNLVANVLQFDAALGRDTDDSSMIAILPFSHSYSLTTNLHLAMLRRSALFTMHSFEPSAYLQMIADYRPSMLVIIPPIASFLSRFPSVDAVDTSSVQLIVCGAAPLDGDVARRLEERLDARVVQGYGMTEMSPVTHVIRPTETVVDQGTIGHALPNVVFRVVDQHSGLDVASPAPGEESEPGELWCTGPNAMLGYRDADPEDTTLDADGWIHTGDLVSVDSDGVVRIIGRIKELIKRRGYQIAPSELEAILCSHPAVADAGVVGIPSRTPGDEVPHAVVQLRLGADATSSEIASWVSERVTPYKRLGGVHLVPSIPRSQSGKLLRSELAALATDATEASPEQGSL